jgi:hypothetical protein
MRIFGSLAVAATVLAGAAGVWRPLEADSTGQNMSPAEDPYLWLEDVHGAKPLGWVKDQNAKALSVLTSDPDYRKDYDSLLAVLDATDRIPFATLDHQHAYNFWQDATHPKGVWRRATISDYAKTEPRWDLLLDVDKLASDDKENWVWKGADCAPSQTRCLVRLSRGGGDATVVREFSLASKGFIPDGFALPEAKSDVTYIDDDTILFGTDFGKGTLTIQAIPASSSSGSAGRRSLTRSRWRKARWKTSPSAHSSAAMLPATGRSSCVRQASSRANTSRSCPTARRRRCRSPSRQM